jgi:hypothetical protein
MATSIRINVEIPDPKKTVTEGLKKNNSVIDKVEVNLSTSGTSTVTCAYGEKKHSSVDKNKLERELKEIIGKMGYRVR